MGLHKNRSLVYLFDYGLAKKFITTSKNHIPFNGNKRMVGTLRYASINSQLGCELSRRDDLESLGYCIIYMLKGRLPWQGVIAESKTEKHNRVLVNKQDILISELCRGLPIEIARYMYYCRNLLFEDVPLYSRMYKLFGKVIERTQRYNSFEFDWEAMKCDLVTRTYKDKNDSNKAEREVPRKSSKYNMPRKIEINNLASGIYLEISAIDNKNLNKKALVSSELRLLPEEEKVEFMEVDNKGNCCRIPVVPRSSAVFYRKQGRPKVSSQGSQERTVKMSYKYFLAGNSIISNHKNTQEEDEFDFRALDITERVHIVTGKL
jgi:serine/threonine protein kinase